MELLLAIVQDYGDYTYHDPGPSAGAVGLGCLCSLLVGLAFGFVGRSIGASKGLGTAGFWLGFFLGVIGLIIVAVLQGNNAGIPRRRRHVVRRALEPPPGPGGGVPCPYCAELIRPGARLCRFCKSQL
jgi:hypothetical protein